MSSPANARIASSESHRVETTTSIPPRKIALEQRRATIAADGGQLRKHDAAEVGGVRRRAFAARRARRPDALHHHSAFGAAGVATDDDGPRAHAPGGDEPFGHIRIRAREILGHRRRVGAEHQQRAVRRIAERSGEQQDATRVGVADPLEMRLAERHAPLDEIGDDVIEQGEMFHQYLTGASPRSISARYGSSHGGSFRSRPSDAGASSIANPGCSVATSNSTPPGSRK